jgi:hypothetical protein
MLRRLTLVTRRYSRASRWLSTVVQPGLQPSAGDSSLPAASAAAASAGRPASRLPTPASAAPLAWHAAPHEGVIVDIPALSRSPSSALAEQLQASLVAWTAEGRKSVWITADLSQGDLLRVAADAGFEYHHAQGQSATLMKWLSPLENRVPPYASHQVRRVTVRWHHS